MDVIVNKKAILINSLFNGGAEKVVSVLLSELHNQNYDIELICLEKNDFYSIPKDIKVTYLTNFTGKESRIKKLLFLPIFARKLKKYIKNNNISLIQSHVYRANYVNVLARIFGAKHKVQIVNAGQISRYKEEGFLGKVNLFLVKHLYSKADLIICKSKGMLEDMQELFDFRNEKIVINNPYDIEKINLLKQEKVDDFIFQKDKKYIITVGRLIALKRNIDLINTLSNLSDEIEVIFLGEGEEKENLKKLSIDLRIENRCHFLGRVENPFKYLMSSHLFISCSESEGFPNVLVEAMICGLPVISTDCKSGPREILSPISDIKIQLKDSIEYSEYGILIPVHNKKRMQEAIIKILSDEELRNNYIIKGKIRAKSFELINIVDKYKKVLNI